MNWQVIFHPEFEREFYELDMPVREEGLAQLELLRKRGPSLGRPHVDTLKGSKHANLKELRFTVSKQHWRIAFVFDPDRQAIVLCGGSKSGKSSNRFYQSLIKTAESRYDDHLARRHKERTQ